MNKVSENNRKALRSTANKFLCTMQEKVSTYVFLGDVDALDRLVTQMDILSGYEVIKTLRDKGLSKEITRLCDKAGRLEAKKHE